VSTAGPTNPSWTRTSRYDIPTLLEDNATTRPDKICLRFDDIDITYAEIHRRSTAVANQLTALGLRPGGRVGALMYNCPELLYLWFATAKLGAIFVPINVNYRGEFLRHQLATARVEIMVTSDDLARPVADVADGAPSLAHLVLQLGSTVDADALGDRLAVHSFEDLLAGPDDEVRIERRPRWNDPNAIIFTAGTTGPSKGAVLTQHYLVRAARQLFVEMRDGREDDVSYSPLPLFHLNALIMGVLGPMTTGATGALDKHFSVSRFWDRVRHYQATQCSILGTMISMLWQVPASDEDRTVPIRVMLAAPIPAELHHRFEERFGLRLVCAYGLSEAVPLLISSVDDPPPPGAAGKPNPVFDIQLVDDEDTPVRPGTAGEIICRPREPHVMFEGYDGNPEATVTTWRNLWFHTGDLVRQRDDGWFEFVDRKKDYIRRRGENISSFEVEHAILLHPAVADVAVHAVASEFSEDDVKACVVLHEGSALEPKELLDHCVANMPYFAVPRYIEFFDEIPKNPVGRVLKYQLRERGATPTTWDREAAGYRVGRPSRPT